MEISYLAPQDDAIWAHGSVVLGLAVAGSMTRKSPEIIDRSLTKKKSTVIINRIALEKQN
jgi:hypothetical protein